MTAAPDKISSYTAPAKKGPSVEVKIGIQNVAREIVIDATGSEDQIVAAVEAALGGQALDLRDERGRRVVVPAGALGYVDLGEPSRGRVGFGAS